MKLYFHPILLLCYLSSFCTPFYNRLFGIPSLIIPYLILFLWMLFRYNGNNIIHHSLVVLNSGNLFVKSLIYNYIFLAIITPFITLHLTNSFVYIIQILIYILIGVGIQFICLQDKLVYFMHDIYLLSRRFILISCFSSLLYIALTRNIPLEQSLVSVSSDPNLINYLSLFLLVLSLLFKNFFFSLFLVFVGFLSFSRSFILMSSIVFIFVSFNQLKRLFSLRINYRLLIYAITVLFTCFAASSVIVSIYGFDFFTSFSNGFAIIDKLLNPDLASTDLLGEDSRRGFLIEYTQLAIQDNFPFPIGFGLSNYLSVIKSSALSTTTVFARSHNFYLSALLEQGIFSLITLFSLLFITLMNFVSDRYIYRLLGILQLSFLSGLFFNEYFFQPFVFPLFFAVAPSSTSIGSRSLSFSSHSS